MAQTTLDEWAKNPVDPEIRAHVSGLITAVRSIEYMHQLRAN
jgi:replication fork protection complex subunit Tof1/Swi1